MNRHKRHTSPLQAVAVVALSTLFVLTALVGLYKCFSEEPLVPPDTKLQEEPADASQEPGAVSERTTSALSSRKEHFHTILLGGLDDENGGSDTNLRYPAQCVLVCEKAEQRLSPWRLYPDHGGGLQAAGYPH